MIPQIKPTFKSYASFFPEVLKAVIKRNLNLHYIFDPNVYKAIFFSKKLYLNRLVKFNNSYFFSITIPAFPSKAYKYMYKNGGLCFSLAGTKKKKHFETLILGISDDCSFNCTHCYEKLNLSTKSAVDLNKWKETITYFQKQGVSIIVLSGGEPLLNFNNTLELIRYGNKDLSNFHIHTSGSFLTTEKACALKEAGLTAAAVGLDHPDPAINDRIRGKDSYRVAVDALKIFNKAGIMTYVNLCAGKEILSGDCLLKYYDLLKDLNVSFIELLEPRPCGGFSNQNEYLLSASEKEKLRTFAYTSNFDTHYKTHPIVYYVAHVEHKDLFGCNMGALSLLYIDTKGNVNPCVFVPVSFGNIMNEDIDIIFKRIRKAIPQPVRKECPSLLLAQEPDLSFPIDYKRIEHRWENLIYGTNLSQKK